MDKKLPKVFQNSIDKEINNNSDYFYSEYSIKESKNNLKKDVKVKDKSIMDKIDSIFTSYRYVYKADVDITFKDNTISKRIIGRNRTHLITIDNELIPISDIIDINFSEEKSE